MTTMPMALLLIQTGTSILQVGTSSSDFPVTPGVYQPRSGGLNDVFVTKLDSTGSSIVYSTHIGVPVEGIRGFGIAVDASGSAYVAGGAGPGFPTTMGAFQTATNAFSCGFVLKMKSDRSDADYSTLLGGGDFNDIDYAESIALDESGDAYVTGYASSTTFPTTPGAFQAALGGGVDGFVTVLNPTGSALLYSTFLGRGLPMTKATRLPSTTPAWPTLLDILNLLISLQLQALFRRLLEAGSPMRSLQSLIRQSRALPARLFDFFGWHRRRKSSTLSPRHPRRGL